MKSSRRQALQWFSVAILTAVVLLWASLGSSAPIATQPRIEAPIPDGVREREGAESAKEKLSTVLLSERVEGECRVRVVDRATGSPVPGALLRWATASITVGPSGDASVPAKLWHEACVCGAPGYVERRLPCLFIAGGEVALQRSCDMWVDILPFDLRAAKVKVWGKRADQPLCGASWVAGGVRFTLPAGQYWVRADVDMPDGSASITECAECTLDATGSRVLLRVRPTVACRLSLVEKWGSPASGLWGLRLTLDKGDGPSERVLRNLDWSGPAIEPPKWEARLLAGQWRWEALSAEGSAYGTLDVVESQGCLDCKMEVPSITKVTVEFMSPVAGVVDKADTAVLGVCRLGYGPYYDVDDLMAATQGAIRPMSGVTMMELRISQGAGSHVVARLLDRRGKCVAIGASSELGIGQSSVMVRCVPYHEARKVVYCDGVRMESGAVTIEGDGWSRVWKAGDSVDVGMVRLGDMVWKTGGRHGLLRVEDWLGPEPIALNTTSDGAQEMQVWVVVAGESVADALFQVHGPGIVRSRGRSDKDGVGSIMAKSGFRPLSGYVTGHGELPVSRVGSWIVLGAP